MSKLPDLVKNEYGFLIGKIELEVWKGFISRNWDMLRGTDEGVLFDGIIEVHIYEEVEGKQPFDYQKKALEYLIGNQKEIQDKILSGLIKEFPATAAIYDYAEIEGRGLPAEVTELEHCKKIIRPSIIHLMNKEKDGYGYVGYQFACVWDMEHGMGVMTHKSRIIEMGEGDSSFARVNDPEK